MIIYLQMIESDEDKSKFEQLYIMYKGLMFHVAMKILKNEFDAEDAVHQAFLSLIENLKKISDVKCPKTRAYIVIITERKAIDIIRSRSKLVDMEFWESTYGIEIPLPGDHGLADAMARLPAAYRDILLLRYYNGSCKTNVTPGMRFCKRGIRRICSRGSRKPITVSVKCILCQGATMRSFLQSYLNELKSYGKSAV